MTASSAQVLGPGAGWAVVLTVGVAFSFFMMAVSWGQQRYTQFSLKTNEEFNSASRSIRKGLISASIVSAWVWAATILQSSTVAFEYGVSGPYWYAVGGTMQIIIFAITAATMKLNAPFAHTFLQVINVRWGKAMHLVTMAYALTCNVLVGSMLVLGGSDTVQQLTGMPVLAAVFLTPIAVAMYTLTGGLRSTFLADYIHTAVLMALLLMFAIYAYAVSDKIGSSSTMFELLQQAPAVDGNAAGSYTSFRSLGGFKFGIFNIISGFTLVYLDQSYAQRGIAAAPSEATIGFILGGVAWFAVPTVAASTLGLAARALMGKDPSMAILSQADIVAGLAAPAAAVALLGKSGAIAMLLLLYLAVTSATSAQLIAVSSIFTYDIFKAYIKPSATQRQLFICSHVCIAFWAIFLGILGCIWNAIGVSLGYLYVCAGVLFSSAVVPVFVCLGWSKANRNGALFSMLFGTVAGLAVWLGIAQGESGELSLDSTGAIDPTTYAALVSMVIGAFGTVGWSLYRPENFTFETTRAINADDAIEQQQQEREWQKEKLPETVKPEDEIPPSMSADEIGESRNDTPTPSDTESKAADKKADDGNAPVLSLEKGLATSDHDAAKSDVYYNVRRGGLDPEALQALVRNAIKISLPLSFVITVLIPCMAITVRDFGPIGLGVWMGFLILWLFFAACIVILLPVWESRHTLAAIARGIAKDVLRRRRR